MGKFTFLKTLTSKSLALTLCLITAAYSQSIQFPGEVPPVIASASVNHMDSNGRPSMVVDSNSGRTFVPSYDSTGQLTSLKSATGPNAFDLRAISYTPDGRVASVLFGNRYQLFFRYRNDGTQEIVDSVGGEIIRSQTAVGQFVTQSAVDPGGFLIPSLRLLGTLFSLFGQVPGQSSSIAQ